MRALVRMVWPLLIGFVAALGIAASVKAGPQPVTVDAIGVAFVTGPSDMEPARRRALVDALVTAALAGGARMQGYTAQYNGRIVADMALLQAAGRVLSHRLVAATFDSGQWTVRISANVGPPLATACSGRRHLTISATPPAIDVRPDVPAWAGPLARQLALDAVDRLRNHPATTLESIAPVKHQPVGLALDYTALTRGTIAKPQGNHRLAQSISITRQKNTLSLVLTLALLGSDGEQITRQITRTTRVPPGGVAGLLTGQGRRQAEHALTDGIIAQITSTLDQIGCQAPQARLAVSGGQITVPLGAAHGLSRSKLAVVEGRTDQFGVLQLTHLQNRSAVLAPLDPTRTAAGFAGARVYFVDIGQ